MTTAAPALEFVASSHRYYLDDRELPGVTSILKDAGLIDDTWFTDEARLRGTYVHAATHYLDDGDLAEESVDPRLAGYLEAYRRFLAVTRPTWELREHRVCDPIFGYAGTLDRVGVLGSTGAKVILDIKTGGLPPSVGLQLAAYRRCLTNPYVYKRVALQLKADGSFSLHDCTDRRDEQRFLNALDLWNWKQENLRRG